MSFRSALSVSSAALVLLLSVSSASAQQRPLVTEDPETIGAGRILLEFGVKYEKDVFLPLSGLRGDVFTVPPLGISVGVSSIAEIQFDAGLFQKMFISEVTPAPFSSLLKLNGTDTVDVEDLNIGAKIKFLNESPNRPAMGFRFSTRLPNASNESGLGKDIQDFQATIVGAKTVQSVRTVVNAGFLILGNPIEPAKQDDLFIFSLSVARAISAKAEFVGEYSGRMNFADIVTPGAENRGRLLFGGRYTHAGVRLDGAIMLGVTPRDPEIGFNAGITWVFTAFRVP